LSYDVTWWSEHDILFRKCMPAGWCKSKMTIGCNWDGKFCPCRSHMLGRYKMNAFKFAEFCRFVCDCWVDPLAEGVRVTFCG
jgi:hypothetical protein